MKKRNKILGLMVGAVALVGVSVMGTMAYLTSNAKVSNTFSVGNVEITLDESPVDKDGNKTTGNPTTGNSYKLLPNKDYDKDPTVHVSTGSEDCWLFVKVDNGIEAIEAQTEANGYKSIKDQMAGNGWTLVSGTTDVYAYSKTVGAGDNIPVFTKFKISGTETADSLANYTTAEIVIKAYAVQAQGFSTAAAAWTGAPTDWNFD